MLQDTYENRLHLRKTQINLVFHSIYTIFALRFAKRDCPRCAEIYQCKVSLLGIEPVFDVYGMVCAFY